MKNHVNQLLSFNLFRKVISRIISILNLKWILILITVNLLISYYSFSQAIDPTPYRGIYVNDFIKTNDPAHTILGSNLRETELLEFAKANNIKRLDFYTLYPTFNSNWGDINPLTSNTYANDYCSFANRAKDDYCIEQFAVAGSSIGFFNNINVWNTLIVTAPYSFATSHIPNIATFFSDYSFVQNSYTAADGNIALVSEYLKCYLRIIDRYYENNNLITGCKFDVFDIEYEYWRSYTNYDWNGFKTLLNALVTLNTNTSYHFKIHVYTVLKNIPPNAPTFFIQEEANFIDPIAHRIYLTDYPEAPNNDPQHFWSYFPFLPGVIAFRNSNPSGTLITPLLNNDGNGNPEGLFDWLNDATHPEQSLYKSEKIFLDDAIQNHIADIGNSIITEGSFQWFKYTPAKQASSNSQNNQYCTNNELFYINGATNYCPGIPTVTICNPLTLSYIGNYETGVTCDWTFGDGNGISGALPEDQTHTYHALGTYTISCHVKFPPSAISPSQTCDYEFHRDVTIIGAAVNAGLDQTICSSNIVPLQGSYSGAASSATWSTNGTGTFNNISSPTATYIASSADIANGEVLLTFTTNNPSGACGAVNDDVKITFATSPSISFSPSNPSICFGNSVGLNANGASSFLWSPSSGLSCTTCSSPTANPTVTTTYTVIGTSNDCSSTATITVIVIPSVSVSPTSPLAFCTGGSGITLTASNATSYSWIPANGLNCTTCSVVNANPSVTTTYTVVGTGTNGCTNSSTSVVTILANPPVSITPGGAPCIGTQLCTNTGFTSYSWLPNHETTSCIPTSAPISIYSVTVTNANGCTSSASASLTLSCCGGGTLLNQSSFNANIIPAGTYNLNSNILLSHSVTLDGCIITIGAGYSITVPNQYTLTVQNGAELSACGNMWRGIIVNGGGTFTSLPTGANCKIKDAQYAVEVKDNGTINIDKCDFINDYIGVNLYDLGAAGPIHINGYIKNSSFSTIGSLKAVNPSGVPNNFQYTHSFAGIRAYNVSLFNVGVNNGTSVNQFIDLNFGIHSTNSNLGVTDYRFRRIKKYDLPPIDTSALRNYGSAVFTTGNPTANYLTMTGRKITTDPDFQECHYAVNSSNSNINIKVNKIDNCDFGIYVSQGNSLIINAINNYIDCNTYGVSLIAVDRFSHSAIYSNIIYGGQRQTDVNGIPTLATGINVAGFNHINTNTHIIQNSIHLFDYGFAGIELNAIKSSFVSFNYITLHNSVNNTMKGISLSGSQENTISCNSVNGTVSGQINYSTDETGYDIFDSQSNDIRCNAATQTSNGYRFSGTCNGGLQSTTLTSNDIGSHYNGLIYTFSALVDPQINQGNWWYQTTYPGFAATNLNPSQLAVANERYDVYANLLSGQNLPIPS